MEVVGQGGLESEERLVRHQGVHRQWRVEVLEGSGGVAPEIFGGAVEMAVLEDENAVVPMLQEVIIHCSAKICRSDRQQCGHEKHLAPARCGWRGGGLDGWFVGHGVLGDKCVIDKI